MQSVPEVPNQICKQQPIRSAHMLVVLLETRYNPFLQFQSFWRQHNKGSELWHFKTSAFLDCISNSSKSRILSTLLAFPLGKNRAGLVALDIRQLTIHGQ